MNIDIRKIKLAMAGFAILGATSCDVIDLTPANMISDEVAFETPARVETAVLGVYQYAQQGFYNGAVGRGYPFGAANVQQGEMRGEDMYNDQLFYEITYTGTHSPQSLNNNEMWGSLYRLINSANIVMDNLDGALDKGVLDQEKRDTYRGEMLFMRALAHHELLLNFARPYSDDPNALGVPYRTFPVNDVTRVGEGEVVERTTVGADYAQLLVDLDEAENLLPDNTNAFRIRRGAAIALKARVKLHMGDWAGVIEEFNKLDGTYAVTEDVKGPFRGGQSSDNIFSFRNSAESNPNVNGALASMLGNPARGARGLVKISPLIWTADFWLEEDFRRTFAAGSEDGMVSSNAAGIYTHKYIDPVTYTDPNPILRFAEIVLSAAEAHARLGNNTEAAALVNRTRSRALPAGTPEISAGLDQEALLEAIFQERRIELLAEGKRWGDIHRLSGEGRMNGVPEKASSRSITSLDFYSGETEIPVDHELPYSSNMFVWPLPLLEIQNNTSKPLEQNPGY